MRREIKMYKLFVFFTVGQFWFLGGINPAFLWAAPSISSVSGTVSDGQTVTIAGSGFGAYGPTVVLFDNFELGTNGESIKTGPGSARVGGWNSLEAGSYATYSNSYKVSGSLAARFNMASYQPVARFKFDNPVTDTFLSWWMMIPSGTYYPGEGGEGINWKTVWIMGDKGGEPDPGKWDQTLPSLLGGPSIFFTGNNTPYNKWMNNWHFEKGRWWRCAVWIKGGYSSDGTVKYWTTDDKNATVTQINDSNVTTIGSGGSRAWAHLNGYGRITSNCYPHFDDFYLAIGQYAQARVEIGNNATYSSCTNLTILTPTLWSDTSITATVRQGSFTTGSSAYLFVFDANGAVNTTGYPVTFVSVKPPAAPTGLKIVN